MHPVHDKSAAGNFSLLLLRCTFFPRELISEYTTDWLEPELFPMWDGKPISPIPYHCSVWDRSTYYLEPVFTAVFGDVQAFQLFRNFDSSY